MRTKYILISLIALLIGISGYLLSQRTYLKNTANVPFCNLLHIDNDNCFIYFNIEHDGNSYPVVYVYFFAEDRFVSRSLRWLGPYYFNEIIRHDMNILVDDSTFSQIKDRIVNRTLIERYLSRDLLSDTSIVKDNFINKRIQGEERKAIIYCLLRQNVNCCFEHEDGVVQVSRLGD